MVVIIGSLITINFINSPLRELLSGKSGVKPVFSCVKRGKIHGFRMFFEASVLGPR
jgi:hypothetical protein